MIWWSWILTSTSLFSLYLIGKRKRSGWTVGLAGQGLWVAYAIVTWQLGFLVGAIAYGYLQYRGYKLWK